MKKFVFIIIILSLPTLGHSSVNLRNGSYTESWIDFISPQKGIEMKIERYYSSRSLFIGLFGFGWCSNMETHLTITSDGIINLTECGGGLEVTYYPKDFDLVSPKDTIRKIVNDFRKNKKLKGPELQNLESQLKENTKMRFEHANKLGLVNIQKIKSKNNTFLAKTKGYETIRFNGNYYERKRVDGSTERFNKKGQLIQIINSSGLWLKIHYNGSKIAFLSDKKGQRLNFSYTRNGRLAKVSNGQNLSVTYTFEGENLIQVTNMWKKTYDYVYDNNHNLTAVKFPDNTQIKMSYDISKDWIKSYTNRNNCREEFDFQLARDDPKNHYWSSFSRECPKEPKTVGKHEFWYKNYSFTNDKYLHRAQEIYEKDYKDYFFHKYLGRPIAIRENEIYQGFGYYFNGLLNQREYKRYTPKREVVEWNKMSFKHNVSKFQVYQTIQKFYIKSGKKSSEVEVMNYQYNSNNLLYKAANTKGKSIQVGYDENGKIVSLVDENNKKLKLTYNRGMDKPTSIEESGLGKITITYDSEGEIKSVKNIGKRNVASSVVERFMQMVNFLGPMGENLEL